MAGLFIALENEEMMEAATQADAGLEGGVDGLEAAVVDVNEGAAAVDELDTAIEEAVEGAEELDAQAGVMEASLADTDGTPGAGLDETGAAAIEISVESICRRLGIERAAGPRIAVESFGGSGDRREATKLALESIQETVKKTWEKIVAGFKAMVAKVVAWFKSVFDSAERLKGRVKALSAKVDALQGEAATKTFKNDKLVAKVGSGADLKAANLVKTLANVAKEVKGQAAYSKLTYNLTKDGASGQLLPGWTATENAGGEGMASWKSAEFPGNRCVIVTSAATAAGLRENPKVKVTVGPFDPKATKPAANAVAVGSKEELKKVLAGVGAVAAGVADSKSGLAEFQKAAAAATKAMQDAINKADAKSEEAKAEMSVARATGNMVVGVTQNVNSLAIDAASNAAHYVESCLKAWGKAPEAAAA